MTPLDQRRRLGVRRAGRRGRRRRARHGSWRAAARPPPASPRSAFPSTRDEEWRFTPVAPIASDRLARPLGPSAPVTRRRMWPRSRLCRWPARGAGRRPSSSRRSRIAAGVAIVALVAAGRDRRRRCRASSSTSARIAPPTATPFSALSLATFTDGVVLHLAAGTSWRAPLEILHLTTAPPMAR